MTNIVQMSKGGTKFYPQTHVQAVLGLPDFSSFEKASDVQTAITNAISPLQTQVNNSAVGTNLYQDTRDFDNPDVWSNFSNWNKTGDKFNGLTVMTSEQDWAGLSQIIQAKKGETYTYSVYARCKSGTGKSTIYYMSKGSTVQIDTEKTIISLNETWQRIKGTVGITADGPINIRIEKTDDNPSTLLIAGPKLEKGPTATDWCPNPLEIATNDDVQAAISGFQKASDVQTAITTALSKVDTSQTMNDSTRTKLQNMNKEMGS